MAARTPTGTGSNSELGVERPRSALKDPIRHRHLDFPHAHNNVFRYVLGVRKDVMTLFGVVVLVAGACSSSEPATDRVQPRGVADAVRQPVDPEVKSFMARYPTLIQGRFGTSDTSRYQQISTQRLSDMPYGPKDGVLFFAHGEDPGAAPPTEMPGLSRVVIRGQVMAIGPPHFNSLDGSFWTPELHEEPEVTDVARVILRDVLFKVDEVWGSLLPEILPGSLVPFVVRGGQVAVTLSEKVARQLEYGPSGVYIFGEEPVKELSVGEYAVVFLDVRPIFGLYGGRYGARFELAPAQEAGFKYIHKDPNTIGVEGQFEYDISVPSIKSIIQTELGQLSDYPDAELGLIYDLGPHPPGEGERAPIVGLRP